MKVVKWIVYDSPLAINEMGNPPFASNEVIVNVGADADCRTDCHGWRCDWGWIALQPMFAILKR